MRVLGIIPARGGSRGVPRKNIKSLGGKPLLQYTAEAALGARRLSKIILSTDDKQIAEVGLICGLEVPFMRPPEIAEDSTPTLPVVQHAVHWMENRGMFFDAVCLLQPTNPFRRAADIDGCIELLEESGADSVVTMLPVPDEYNPHWVYLADSEGTMRLFTGETIPIARRQELPPAFHREGSVYVTQRDVLVYQNSLYGNCVRGYVLNGELGINIDNPSDWARAEERIGFGK
ncbi:MAG: CMP-N,N-diacetyllegionaminic acid synthase [Blastocatellia bacterium]|jgi:CMP-N-acetylneuraminic acid synthetase|nr:CMP-N,N-diacetyllegionaminic acid synthase [Blastocatellia bacterium]